MAILIFVSHPTRVWTKKKLTAKRWTSPIALRPNTKHETREAASRVLPSLNSPLEVMSAIYSIVESRGAPIARSLSFDSQHSMPSTANLTLPPVVLEQSLGRKRTISPFLYEPDSKRSRTVKNPLSPIHIHEDSLPTSPEMRSLDSPVHDGSFLSLNARLTDGDISDEQPSSPSALHPPPSPLAAPPSSGRAADRFAKSRSVGQTHRDNEKYFSDTMQKDVEKLRAENVLLFAMLTVNHGQARNGASAHMAALLRNRERAEAAGFHRLSNRAATILGLGVLSGAMAMIMLELIAARRNLIAVSDLNTSNRRRRRTTLSAPAQGVVEGIILAGLDKLRKEGSAFNVVPQYWVDSCLDSLRCAHKNWAEHEQSAGAPIFEDEPFSESEAGRSIRNRVESPKPRPGEGPKRCSRCRKFKTAGSGHGRSKCDDHMLISSSIPYPAPPCTLESASAAS